MSSAAQGSSTVVDTAKHAWPDTEALVAIVGLAIALSVATAGAAAIASGRVVDDTRPARAGASIADDEIAWPYVFGA